MFRSNKKNITAMKINPKLITFFESMTTFLHRGDELSPFLGEHLTRFPLVELNQYFARKALKKEIV